MGVTSISNASLVGIVTTGRKIHARGFIDNTAVITGVGGKVLGVGIMTGGLRYAANGAAGLNLILINFNKRKWIKVKNCCY